ncbi:cupin domain-containing protein [Actinomycetospora sp. C-140]
MLLPDQAHVVRPGEGAVAELGIARMRVLAAGETTGRTCTLAEFSGGPGAWTVPHRHLGMEESFYVLDGSFDVGVGDTEVHVEPGDYLLVPRDTRHVLAAGPDGGRCLVLMVPGGLEDMFFELGGLSADAIRDPAVRAAISARHDSVPA